MTVTAGRHSAPQERRAVPVRSLLGYAVGALLSAAAWAILVNAAIDFGRTARDGEGVAWVFVALAVIGAIGCLLLTLVLAGRALMAIGVISDYAPRRARRG